MNRNPDVPFQSPRDTRHLSLNSPHSSTTRMTNFTICEIRIHCPYADEVLSLYPAKAADHIVEPTLWYIYAFFLFSFWITCRVVPQSVTPSSKRISLLLSFIVGCTAVPWLIEYRSRTWRTATNSPRRGRSTILLGGLTGSILSPNSRIASPSRS